MSRGDALRLRPLPVLRRRRAGARGPVGRRVHGRPHLVGPPRADRRGRPGDAVELPADDDDLEDRARRWPAGNTDRAQAQRHHARELDRCSPRCARSSCRPASSTSSAATATPAARWSSTRPRRWSRSPARCAPAWRSPARRPTDLKRVHLELGGKAPVIVFDDADIEKAAEGIAVAGYFNAGQDCTAATRVLAGPGVHDDFVAALTEQAKNTKTGLPDDEDVLYGAAQQRRTSSTGSPAWSTGCPTTRPSTTGGTPAGRASATSTSRPCSPACSRTTSRSRTRSSARSSPCRSSPTRPRRCAGPTAWSTASPRASGPRTTAARCGCPSASTSACVWINTHIPFVSEMPHGGFKHSRLRQGPVDVRPRGLHAHQARHVLHRRVSSGPRTTDRVAQRSTKRHDRGTTSAVATRWSAAASASSGSRTSSSRDTGRPSGHRDGHRSRGPRGGSSA